MKRLTYSPRGHIRSIQLSRAGLHVFVEGRNVDCYIYGKILAHECGTSFEHKITRADQLPNATAGGKSVLREFFRSIRRAGALAGEFKGHKFSCLFFLDKDVEDLLGTRLRSKHVFSTPTYDVEGSIFLEAPIAEVVAAACSLDPAHVTSKLNVTNWVETATANWREWVILCVTATFARCHGVANYASPSQVNPSPSSAPQTALVAAYESRLRASSPLNLTEFNKAFARAQRTVTRAYEGRNALSLFKGKWLAFILDDQVKLAFPVEHSRTKDFKSRVTGHVAQAADPNGAWCAPMRARVRMLVDEL